MLGGMNSEAVEDIGLKLGAFNFRVESPAGLKAAAVTFMLDLKGKLVNFC